MKEMRPKANMQLSTGADTLHDRRESRRAAISQVGIMNLVKYGYSLLGYINLFVIILPALILGGRKISKK